MEKYKKLKKLGQGSFGQVFLVADTTHPDQKLFVCKEIDLHAVGPEFKNGSQEPILHSMMNHPNIISVVEYFKDDQNMYLILQYAEGGTLEAKLTDRNSQYMPEQQVLEWMVQLCLAVQHMHARKVLHRDIKTSNIFITKEWVLKLGDFGVARLLSNSHANASTQIGTPYYLSPEMCSNEGYNQRSDMWALGVVAYEMTALKRPFQGGNILSLVHNIISAKPAALPRHFSADWRNLVIRLLEKNPQQRPTVDQVLQLPFLQKVKKRVLTRLAQIAEEEKSASMRPPALEDAEVQDAGTGDDNGDLTDSEPAPSPGQSPANVDGVSYSIYAPPDETSRTELRRKLMDSLLPDSDVDEHQSRAAERRRAKERQADRRAAELIAYGRQAYNDGRSAAMNNRDRVRPIPKTHRGSLPDSYAARHTAMMERSQAMSSRKMHEEPELAPQPAKYQLASPRYDSSEDIGARSTASSSQLPEPRRTPRLSMVSPRNRPTLKVSPAPPGPDSYDTPSPLRRFLAQENERQARTKYETHERSVKMNTRRLPGVGPSRTEDRVGPSRTDERVGGTSRTDERGGGANSRTDVRPEDRLAGINARPRFDDTTGSRVEQLDQWLAQESGKQVQRHAGSKDRRATLQGNKSVSPAGTTDSLTSPGPRRDRAERSVDLSTKLTFEEGDGQEGGREQQFEEEPSRFLAADEPPGDAFDDRSRPKLKDAPRPPPREQLIAKRRSGQFRSPEGRSMDSSSQDVPVELPMSPTSRRYAQSPRRKPVAPQRNVSSDEG